MTEATEPLGGGHMTLWEHLAELRSRLTKCVVAVLIGAVVGWLVFDPLLTLPLTPGAEGVVEIHGSDVAGTAHVAVRNGDDSYGIVASTPLSGLTRLPGDTAARPTRPAIGSWTVRANTVYEACFYVAKR